MLILGATLPTVPVANEPIYLHNLYDSAEISGRFFLGTGPLDTDEVYHYYQIVPNFDGRYEYSKMKKIDAQVQEGNWEKPYLQKYHLEYKNLLYGLLGTPPGFHLQTEPKAVFYIPFNSIDTNYKSK
jgi:hypothetical protein